MPPEICPEGFVSEKVELSVADININLNCVPGLRLFLPPERQELCRFFASGEDVFPVKVFNRPRPEILPNKVKEQVFDSGAWGLFRLDDGRLLLLDDNDLSGSWERALFVDPKFRRADLYTGVFLNDENTVYDPLSYPFDQLMMIGLLGRRRGVMAHGCGLDYERKGVLFVGPSGEGKTTTADLWSRYTETQILNDDRVIIRQGKGGFSIYGTPWHGTGRYAKPHSLKLNRIYFLKQAPVNEERELNQLEANLRLMPLLFAPFWDKEAMAFTLEFCAELIRQVQIFELSFTPDQNSINYVRQRL